MIELYNKNTYIWNYISKLLTYIYLENKLKVNG